MKRNTIFAAGVLLAMISTSSMAWAYIPPSYFIVKKLSAKKAGFKTIRVRTQVQALSNEIPNGTAFQTVSIFDASQRALRTRAYDAAGTELYATERKLGATQTSWLTSLLFDPSAPDLATVLKANGIPIRTEEELLALDTEEQRRKAEIAWLSRIKGVPTWVFGAKKKPQLWIDKNQLLPMKLADDRREIRFEGYRYVQEFPYPRSIVMVLGEPGVGTPEFHDDLLEMNVNAPADLIELRTSVPIVGFTDAGNSAPSEVRDLLVRYFQTIR